MNIHWKDWCQSSNTLVTWCEEMTHWKRPWCWERLKAGGEGRNRGRDGWMASLTQWTWVWANSRWWRTGKPGVLQSMGSQRVRHNLATEQQQLDSDIQHIFMYLSFLYLPWWSACLNFLPYLYFLLLLLLSRFSRVWLCATP